MPSGTAFAIDIVCRACTSCGVLKKHWNLVLEKRSPETLLLVSHWVRALGGASETSRLLGGILAVTSPNTFMGVARGESRRNSTARPLNLEAEFPLGGKGHPSRAIN
jgi:hypothetical protein